MNNETTNSKQNKQADYDQIFYEGLIWKKRFESDYFKKEETPEEEPWFPTVFSNTGKLHSAKTEVQNSMDRMISQLQN